MSLNIRQYQRNELIEQLQLLGEPKFRANQVYDWLWKNKVYQFEEMRNLPASLIQKLKEHFYIDTIKVHTIQKSSDETVKVAFETSDKRMIEGVLIPSEDRVTACISSQVGCTLACKFCATGMLKRERDLLFYEIYDQVYYLHKIAVQHYQQGISNIVYMGMGEPLLNFEQVMKSLEYINSVEEGLGIGAKRITISTSGISRNIRKLADQKIKVNLALSLHAANDEKRVKIMDINKSNPIAEVVDAMKYYYDKTQNKITFEYVLLKGFNDTIEDAVELAEWCKKLPDVFVNIIEFNAVEGIEFKKSTKEQRDAFVEKLRSLKVSCKVRRSRGKDIDAACGQLANKNQQ